MNRFVPRSAVLSPAEVESIVAIDEFCAAEFRRLAQAADADAHAAAAEREAAREAGFLEGRDAGLETLWDAIRDIRSIAARFENHAVEIVRLAIDAVFEGLSDEQMLRGAVRRAIAAQVTGTFFRFEVAAEGMPELMRILSEIGLDQSGAPGTAGGVSVSVDPLLEPGELVLVSAAGRHHLGPVETRRFLVRALEDPYG